MSRKRGLVHKSKGTIEGWSIMNGMLFGTLILAANQADEGVYIRTSTVKAEYLNHPQRGDLIETIDPLNSVYELGRPAND